MRSRSCPERPTKGSPARSSSRPGASPITIRRARGSPSAKTRLRAPRFKRAAVEGGHGRPERAEIGAGGRQRRRLRRLGEGRRHGGRRRRRRRGAGRVEAVDRRLADRLVGAELELPGEGGEVGGARRRGHGSGRQRRARRLLRPPGGQARAGLGHRDAGRPEEVDRDQRGDVGDAEARAGDERARREAGIEPGEARRAPAGGWPRPIPGTGPPSPPSSGCRGGARRRSAAGAGTRPAAATSRSPPPPAGRDPSGSARASAPRYSGRSRRSR